MSFATGEVHYFYKSANTTRERPVCVCAYMQRTLMADLSVGCRRSNNGASRPNEYVAVVMGLWVGGWGRRWVDGVVGFGWGVVGCG